jgi:pyruvate dehydrogenase E2 component (dihydrolipoamide acetyltransferase)
VSKETVRVPDIGGVDAAEVVELLVAVGDEVELEQGLLVLESDKASLEIPSTVAGRVVELLAAEGAELAEGDPVVVIETSAAQGADSPAPEQDSAAAETDLDEAGDAPEATSTDEADVQGGSAVTVVVPDIGTEDAVDVVEVSVSVGDTVSEGDSLIVLESDKASMEVPSTVSGTVSAVFAQEGQQLKQGDAVVEIASTTVAAGASGASDDRPAAASASADSGETASPAPAPQTKPASSGPAPEPAATTAPAATASAGSSYAGPAVRRLAREFGVPLEKVRGSGPRGRILKEDLHKFVQGALDGETSASGAGLPVVPEVDFAKFGPVEVSKRSKMDRLTANNMQRSWLNVPHVTQFDDVDISDLEAFRKSLKPEGESRGVKLTIVPFLLKACAVALQRHEKINASLSDGGETLTLKRYVHIGMAVDTPAGLVVPVLRDVDKKSLWELAAEIADLAGRARERKLRPEEMQGACFTISSLGAIGGRGFTPIVNTPEVAILGVSRAQIQPVWDGGAFQPRMQLPVSLSYDHRVVNGGDAGRFLTDLKGLLEDLRRQLL